MNKISEGANLVIVFKLMRVRDLTFEYQEAALEAGEKPFSFTWRSYQLYCKLLYNLSKTFYILCEYRKK